MDVNLLKRFDLVQDVNSLYKEMLRNCRNKSWCWHTSSDIWRSIDNLEINCHTSLTTGDYMLCLSKNNRWIIYKWMYNS